MSDGMVMGRLDSMSSWWQIGWKWCWMVVREWIRGRLAGKEEGLTVTDLQDEKRRGCLWWRSAYGSKREFAPATKGEIWSETCGREKVRSRQRKRNLVSMDLKQLWCQWERRNQGTKRSDRWHWFETGLSKGRWVLSIGYWERTAFDVNRL